MVAYLDTEKNRKNEMNINRRDRRNGTFGLKRGSEGQHTSIFIAFRNKNLQSFSAIGQWFYFILYIILPWMEKWDPNLNRRCFRTPSKCRLSFGHAWTFGTQFAHMAFICLDSLQFTH